MQVAYRSPGADSPSRSPMFGVEAAADGSGLSVLPKECSRQPGSGVSECRSGPGAVGWAQLLGCGRVAANGEQGGGCWLRADDGMLRMC